MMSNISSPVENSDKKLRLHEFLLKHRQDERVSFHMPGHKGEEIFKKFGYDEIIERLADCDTTEVHGADNLFAPSGIIARVQDDFAELYGAEASYLSVNGSSGAIIASTLAVLQREDTAIVAGNSHKSVFNALALSGADAIIVEPSLVCEGRIAGAIRPSDIRRAFEESSGKITAVIIPSPNYYGICSDIKEIADIAHEYEAILIVDQAHGAHLPIFEKFLPGFAKENLPRSAESGGADIVINSTHKTLASFTQSAICNLMNTERVSEISLKGALQMVQSSSPSYILMAGLDICCDILRKHGKKLMRDWADNLEYFYSKDFSDSGFRILDKNAEPLLDVTKINIESASGRRLCGILEDKFGIFPELYTAEFAMCMSGIGNKKTDFQALYKALLEIEENYGEGICIVKNSASEQTCRLNSRTSGERGGRILFLPGRQGNMLRSKKMLMNISDAAGKVAGEAVTAYPPGIPIVHAGERITEDMIAGIKKSMDEGIATTGIYEGKIFVFTTGADNKFYELNPSSYNSYIGSGISSFLPSLIADTCTEDGEASGLKIAIVTEENVASLYGEVPIQALKEAGFKTYSFSAPTGDQAKSIETYSHLVDFLVENDFSKTDVLLGFGGGAVGDLTGFTASTYMRGIKYAHMPTTLLAAVDAAIGGKTGINLPSGKNLIGTFSNPEFMLCDVDFFKSLPHSEFLSGVGELLKYALLDGGFLESIFFSSDAGKAGNMPRTDEIIEAITADYEHVIYEALRIKNEYVSADIGDSGIRKKLNFGHTVGHAIEKCSDFTVPHGLAIATGMVMELRAAYHLGFQGIMKADEIKRVETLLEALGIPKDCDYCIAELHKAALHDKKIRGGMISLPILSAIGESRLIQFDIGRLQQYFSAAKKPLSD